MSYYFGGEQAPTRATARLKKPAYGRKAGELVAHSEVNGKIAVTFLEASFSGGISRREVSLEEFRQNFAVIRKPKR